MVIIRCLMKKLNIKNTLFMLCDVQEKFRTAQKLFEPMVTNIIKLVQAGKILKIPLIVTEQYPEALGHTVKEIDISHAVGVYSKTQFSMWIEPVRNKIKEISETTDITDIVLFGIETHACIEQTTNDLLHNVPSNIHIVGDCTMSRSLQDRDLTLKRLRQGGCLVQTSESIIFNLLQDKNHKNFKEISKLVKEPSVDLFM